jgi:hypothetical protein
VRVTKHTIFITVYMDHAHPKCGFRAARSRMLDRMGGAATNRGDAGDRDVVGRWGRSRRPHGTHVMGSPQATRDAGDGGDIAGHARDAWMLQQVSSKSDAGMLQVQHLAACLLASTSTRTGPPLSDVAPSRIDLVIQAGPPLSI